MNNFNFFERNFNSQTTKLTKDNINDKSNSFIFPFDWLSLKVLTETGEKAINSSSKVFVEYMGIITNKDPFAIAWSGSTQFSQVDQQIEKNKEGGSHYKIEQFDKSKAENFKGHILKNSGSMEFKNASFGDFGDYTAVESDSVINIETTKKITKKDVIERFYVVPNNNLEEEYDDNYVFRISNYENFYNFEGQYIYSKIELSSISSLDLNSGQAYESHIQMSTIGRGYYFPKGIYNDKGMMVDFTYNENLSKDIGVEQIQFEISGNYAFMNPFILGYPLKTYGDENNPILPPRRLFIEELKLPTATPDFKGKNKSNEYGLVNMSLTAMTTFEDWLTRRKEIVGDKQMSYQGMFETNFEESMGTSYGNINDDGNISKDTFLKLLGNKNGIFDLSFINSFFYNQDQKEIGAKNIDFTKLGRKDISTIMNFMTIINSKMELLPLQTGFSTIYSLGKIWGIGKFLNWLTIIPGFNWRRQRKATDKLFPIVPIIPMLLEKGFYETYAKNLFASNDKLKGKLPLEAFNKEDSDTLGVIFGNDSTLSTLSFSLTDKLTLEKWDIETEKSEGYFKCSSIMMGQKIIENGKEKIFLMGQNTEFLKNNESVEYADYTSANIRYIISTFGVQGIGNGDIRTTMFKNDLDWVENDTDAKNSIIFQRTGKTEAGFNNNDLRQINTISNSDLTSLIIKGDIPFEWPFPYHNNDPNKKILDIKKTIEKQDNSSSFSFSEYVLTDYNGTNIQEKTRELVGKGTKIDYTIVNFKTEVDGITSLDELKELYEFLEISSGELSANISITNNVKERQLYISSPIIETAEWPSLDMKLGSKNIEKHFDSQKIDFKIGEMYSYSIKGKIDLKNNKQFRIARIEANMFTNEVELNVKISMNEELILKAEISLDDTTFSILSRIVADDGLGGDTGFQYGNNKSKFNLNYGLVLSDINFKIFGKIMEIPEAN